MQNIFRKKNSLKYVKITLFAAAVSYIKERGMSAGTLNPLKKSFSSKNGADRFLY